MAYNLESLVKVIELILNCPDQRELLLDHKIFTTQTESLLEKSCFLRDSLVTLSQKYLISASLEDQIGVAAQNAEDILENYHFALDSSNKASMIPPPNLRKLLASFDSAKEEMMMMKILEESRTSDSVSSPPAVSSSRRSTSSTDLNPKKILVGFAGDLNQLMDRVLGDSSKLEIIPIVGMGGIGKTTLARNIHDDLTVVSHFDVRAWTTVSDDYSLHNIFLDLLCCVTKRRRDELIQDIGSNKLGVNLHQNLIGKRYLIVLDDIWRSKAWDDVKMFFPNDNNGSQIILTTRESNVATYADSKSPHHQVRLLSEVDGWKLLREKIFGDQETSCPHELEELGRKIANNCGGLPLAIHVIGGLLSHVKRTKDSWKQVAADVSSAIANCNDGEHFSSRILSLSYDHLPYYLKPCFLYMSAFPEDYVIRASKLISLWVAEGFLKPNENKSQEEAAEMYLEALIDRNLIFASQRQKTNGKVKSCTMHDLLRDLCVTEAREKKFFNIMNKDNTPQDNTLRQRRVSVHTSHNNKSIRQMSFARSFIFIGRASPEERFLSSIFSSLRLLRVLDVFQLTFTRLPEALLKLVNLRYLAFSCIIDRELDPRISKFRHLQTLIVRIQDSYGRCTVTPEIIFNMPSLKEIKFFGMYQVWCDLQESKNYGLQVNLYSLYGVEIPNFDMVVEKIPNLRELGICYRKRSDSEVTDLTGLRKLETLKCRTGLTCDNPAYLSNIIFSVSLKKLSLSHCIVPDQACMKTIGMLPNLKILKLKFVSFKRKTWEPSEGEFCRLQLLQLGNVNLFYWPVDENHFPRLQHLIIRGHCNFKEIPSGIGEISTLKTIQVFDSTSCIEDSARRIQEEQLELGNDILQIHISSR